DVFCRRIQIMDERRGHASAAAPDIENVVSGVQVTPFQKIGKELLADFAIVTMTHHNASFWRDRVISRRERRCKPGQAPCVLCMLARASKHRWRMPGVLRHGDR